MKDLSQSERGIVSELRGRADLWEAGYKVFPGEGQGRADCVAIAADGRHLRIQIKSARVNKFGSVFAIIVGSEGRKKRPTSERKYGKADIDAFLVVCAETAASYLVPIDDTRGMSSVCLRLRTTGRVQKNTLFAKDYVLRPNRPRYITAPEAQLDVQRATNAKVAGSNPAGSTTPTLDTARNM